MPDKKIEYLDVALLNFDPENPRLPHSLRAKKDTMEYEGLVIEWMLQYENVIELMASIGEKGFFPAEPLLVVRKGDGYEVVEGNRRLTAIKLLIEPSLATRKKKSVEEIAREAVDGMIPDTVPSIVFDARAEVLAYLGYKHITGVQAWDALAKAKYLKQLLLTVPEGGFYEKCRTLAKIIGSKANYVRLLLIGVDTYSIVEEDNFFEISSLSEASFEFGVFYTALNRGNISKYVGIEFDSDNPTENVDKEHLEDLTKWIFEKNSEGYSRLGESRNLSKLDKILDDKFPKALSAFKDGGKSLNEAVRLTDHPDEIFQKNVNDSLSYLQTARDYLHQVDSPTETQADTLKEILSLSRDMYMLVQSKMLGDTDEI